MVQELEYFVGWVLNDDNVELFLLFWFFLTGFTLGFFGLMVVNYSIYSKAFSFFMENKHRKNAKIAEMGSTIKRLKAELNELRKS
jgi:hypothetical protein